MVAIEEFLRFRHSEEPHQHLTNTSRTLNHRLCHHQQSSGFFKPAERKEQQQDKEIEESPSNVPADESPSNIPAAIINDSIDDAALILTNKGSSNVESFWKERFLNFCHKLGVQKLASGDVVNNESFIKDFQACKVGVSLCEDARAIHTNEGTGQQKNRIVVFANRCKRPT